MKEIKISKNMEADFDEIADPSKMKVECICPKCGQRHVMNFTGLVEAHPENFVRHAKPALRPVFIMQINERRIR